MIEAVHQTQIKAWGGRWNVTYHWAIGHSRLYSTTDNNDDLVHSPSSYSYCYMEWEETRDKIGMPRVMLSITMECRSRSVGNARQGATLLLSRAAESCTNQRNLPQDLKCLGFVQNDAHAHRRGPAVSSTSSHVTSAHAQSDHLVTDFPSRKGQVMLATLKIATNWTLDQGICPVFKLLQYLHLKLRPGDAQDSFQGMLCTCLTD